MLATVVELGATPHEDLWDLIAGALRRRYNNLPIQHEPHDAPQHQRRPQEDEEEEEGPVLGQLRFPSQQHQPQERRLISDSFSSDVEIAAFDESSSPTPAPNVADIAFTSPTDGSYKYVTDDGARHHDHRNCGNYMDAIVSNSDINDHTSSDRRLPWVKSIDGRWHNAEERSSPTTSFPISGPHMDDSGSIFEDQEVDEQLLPRRCDDLCREEGDATAVLESSVQFEVEVAADGTKDVLEISCDSNSIVSNFLCFSMIPGLYIEQYLSSIPGFREALLSLLPPVQNTNHHLIVTLFAVRS